MGKPSVLLILLFESLRNENHPQNHPHPENRIEGNGAGVVGPTKADWGQTGAQLGRNLRRTRASWLQLRPSLRAQDKTNVGNMPNQSQKTFEIAVRMQVFSLSR
jgi:hypothetical protein